MIYTYLFINIFAVLIPFVYSFHPKINFYKNWKYFFPANLLIAFLFILWDIWFTNLGIWGFNEKYITGLYVINLPLEEILFFICIPYACVFTYHCFEIFIKLNWSSKTESIVLTSLSFILFVTGIINYEKVYTATTFISLALLLFIINFLFRTAWLVNFFFTYMVILIPFFIVNGLLTGSFLEEPVVWYDNSENLGIRLFTIPVEDVFYGMELILLNVFFFELLKNKHKKSVSNLFVKL